MLCGMAGLAWRGTTGLNQPDRCSAVYQCLFSLIRYRNTLYTPTAELSGPANDCRDTHGYIKYNLGIGMNVSMQKRKRASGLQCILYNNSILYRETKFCTRYRLFFNFLSKSTLIFDKRQNSSLHLICSS